MGYREPTSKSGWPEWCYQPIRCQKCSGELQVDQNEKALYYGHCLKCKQSWYLTFAECCGWPMIIGKKEESHSCDRCKCKLNGYGEIEYTRLQKCGQALFCLSLIIGIASDK